MIKTPDARWRLATQDIRLDQFESQSAVLFHCASGNTHLLDLFGACLVRFLQQGAMQQSELVFRVAESLNFELEEALQVHLETTLDSLQRLEVIEKL